MLAKSYLFSRENAADLLAAAAVFRRHAFKATIPELRAILMERSRDCVVYARDQRVTAAAFGECLP